MKKALLYIGIALAAIGCTKDADVDPSGDSALTINSSIATRAEKSAWTKDDAIGVYLTTTDATFGDEASNVKFVTSDDSGNFSSSTSLYLPTSGSVEILAYYPYTDDTTFDPKTYAINSADQVDLLSAKNTLTASSSSAVKMSFGHLLSKISLTIKAGNGLTTSDLEDLDVKLSNISTSGEFDLTTSSVVESSLGQPADLALTTISTTTDEQTEISSSAIAIPQALDKATLYFTTESYGTFSATLATDEFTTGNDYTYTVTINQNSVSLSSATITTWVENGGGSSSSADIVDIELKGTTYYINSAAGFAAFRDLVNGNLNTTATHYGFNFSDDPQLGIDGVLTQNIDLGSTGWTTIGFWGATDSNSTNDNQYYSGEFNGGGYEISGLMINNSGNQQSLFRGLAADGVIYNLGVAGSVTNNYGSNDIETTTGYTIGGIVACNLGTIINCYSLVEVKATGITTNAGGITGYNEGKVINCYNQGNVTGYSNVGGIVGWNDGGYVGYCYSTGEVADISTDTQRVGGVVGYNTDPGTDENPTIKGSFCLDNTTNSIGQVGATDNSGAINGNVCEKDYLQSDVFATIITNGADTYNTTYDMYATDLYACSWIYNEGGNYPTLNFNVQPEYSWIYDIIYNGGTYNIYSKVGLQTFAALVNGESKPDGAITSGGDAYFANIFNTAQPSINGAIKNDIDLKKDAWTPIGYSTSKPFKGTLNGGGYEVSGLYINDNTASYQALFGYTDGATISNLGVSGEVTGKEYVGGIVGYATATSIINCYNSATVTASSAYGYVGGIVGYATTTSIINCYNSATVTASTSGAYVGGIAGYNSGTIGNCYNSAAVIGSGSNLGAVVGYNYNSGNIVSYYWIKYTSDDGTTTYATAAIGTDGTNSTDSTDSDSEMTTTDMQDEAFVATLNTNAYDLIDYGACAWKSVTEGYPALDFNNTPTTTE